MLNTNTHLNIIFSAVILSFSVSACSKKTSSEDSSVMSEPKVVTPDFTQYTDTQEKKHAFFEFFYPLVKKGNMEVKAERSQLLKIAHSGTPTNDTIAFVKKLCNNYKVECTGTEIKHCAAVLAEKIGMIPPSLALAQAANESAWGTSRFAREGNNYFGQWCFSKGCGMVPKSRNNGAAHEVRTFDSPMASVRAYIRNLNRLDAFSDFRSIRSQNRLSNSLQHMHLDAVGLEQYSERGPDYVAEISNMIRINKLARYNSQLMQELHEYAH